MTFAIRPIVGTKKNSIPILYLDTCVMLELAKYANDKCTDSHKNEIGELFCLLPQLMKAGKILCPSGNQLQEMGMSRGRKVAKEFLLHFTNCSLESPYNIKEAELAIGYQAFISQNLWIGLNEDIIWEEDTTPASRFRVHLSPIYSQEKLESLKATKSNIVDGLNAAKRSGRIEKNWDNQLISEQLTDFFLAYHSLSPQSNFELSEGRVIDEIKAFRNRTGFWMQSLCDIPDEAVNVYFRFLQSSYHHNLPFQRIEAVLWAHLMQRSNNIAPGDRLDVLWAAAYLPFVDFAVTDSAFCRLLTESGLAEFYGTKVYAMRNLQELIDELHVVTD